MITAAPTATVKKAAKPAAASTTAAPVEPNRIVPAPVEPQPGDDGYDLTKDKIREALKPRPAAEETTAPTEVAPEERRRMIAEAAYYRAKSRGFRGDPIGDWLAAEAEIDARFRR